MRFARQAKIFRGQLDAAPVAGVVFLLLIFLQLSTLLHTPGVLVRLKTPGPPGPRTIRVTAGGEVTFAGNSYKPGELESLRAAIKESRLQPPFDLQIDSGAPQSLAEAVTDLAGIEIPDGSTNLAGTDNPTVVVAVNFLGQYFYDNQIVDESALRKELANRLHEAANLTLVLWADKKVDFSAITHLEQLAGEVGIKEVVQAERPGGGAASIEKPAP